MRNMKSTGKRQFIDFTNFLSTVIDHHIVQDIAKGHYTIGGRPIGPHINQLRGTQEINIVINHIDGSIGTVQHDHAVVVGRVNFGHIL